MLLTYTKLATKINRYMYLQIEGQYFYENLYSLEKTGSRKNILSPKNYHFTFDNHRKMTTFASSL